MPEQNTDTKQRQVVVKGAILKNMQKDITKKTKPRYKQRKEQGMHQ